MKIADAVLSRGGMQCFLYNDGDYAIFKKDGTLERKGNYKDNDLGKVPYFSVYYDHDWYFLQITCVLDKKNSNVGVYAPGDTLFVMHFTPEHKMSIDQTIEHDIATQGYAVSYGIRLRKGDYFEDHSVYPQ